MNNITHSWISFTFSRKPLAESWFRVSSFEVVSYGWWLKLLLNFHRVKSFHIRRFSGQYFPAFGLNTLRAQSKYGKMWTRKTPNKDTLPLSQVSLELTILFWLSMCWFVANLFNIASLKTSPRRGRYFEGLNIWIKIVSHRNWYDS